LSVKNEILEEAAQKKWLEEYEEMKNRIGVVAHFRGLIDILTEGEDKPERGLFYLYDMDQKEQYTPALPSAQDKRLAGTMLNILKKEYLLISTDHFMDDRWYINLTKKGFSSKILF
jgi:hypothetical protein